MANFCTQCGRPLAPGEVCSCQQQAPQQNYQQPMQQAPQMNYQQPQQNYQQAPQQNYQQPQMNYQQAPQQNYQQPQMNYQQGYQQMPPQANPVADYFKNMLDIVKNLFVSPRSGSISFVETADAKTVWGFIGIQAFTGALYSNMGVKNLSYFLTVLLTGLAMIALMGLVLWGTTRMFKGTASYNNSIAVFTVGNIVRIPVDIISIVLALISPGLGAIIAMVGSLLGMCFQMTALFATTKINQEKMPYMLLTTIVFIIIVVVILAMIVAAALVGSAMNEIGSMINSLGDLEGLLNMM